MHCNRPSLTSANKMLLIRICWKMYQKHGSLQTKGTKLHPHLMAGCVSRPNGWLCMWFVFFWWSCTPHQELIWVPVGKKLNTLLLKISFLDIISRIWHCMCQTWSDEIMWGAEETHWFWDSMSKVNVTSWKYSFHNGTFIWIKKLCKLC